MKERGFVMPEFESDEDLQAWVTQSAQDYGDKEFVSYGRNLVELHELHLAELHTLRVIELYERPMIELHERQLIERQLTKAYEMHQQDSSK